MLSVANSEPEKRNRRLLAFALTVIVHAIWLVAVFERESQHRRPPIEMVAGNAITLLHIEAVDNRGNVGQPPLVPSKPVIEPVSEGPTPSEINATVPLLQSPAPAIETQARSGAVTSQPQENAPGGEVYDPYAGASPMRHSEVTTLLPSSADAPVAKQLSPPSKSSSFFELDAAAFETLKEKIRQALGSSKGSVELRVSVSPGGIVMNARLLSGDVAAGDVQKVLGIVVGQALFIVLDPAATEATVDLPPISLRRRWHIFN